MAKNVQAAARKDDTTAVVVIHGMGEQWPMDTLRGFVDAAWTTDRSLTPPGDTQLYFKPEAITGSFELRRVTTRFWTGADRRQIEFFECYWAHLLRDNSLGAVLGWLARLLLRRPSRVPRRLLAGWLAGLLIFMGSIAMLLFTQLDPEFRPFDWPAWPWSAIAAAGAVFAAVWLRPVAGDAARYLSPAPGNVAARQAIREAGIDLLQKLTASGDYDRIILAGHSLGSVIGYDVLNHAWGRLDPENMFKAHQAQPDLMIKLHALERAARRLNIAIGAMKRNGNPIPAAPPAKQAEAFLDWREAQRAYFAELSKARGKDEKPIWLVSDFITLGSPLSKAEVLLAKDIGDLAARIKRRELPVDPPAFERVRAPHFSYPPDKSVRIPHHGAVFAPTVWTNLYYPNLLAMIGDFISGRVAPLLGGGVRDVRIPIGIPWFRHLSYWAKPKRFSPAIGALRRALNLRLRDERSLWGPDAGRNPFLAEMLAEEGPLASNAAAAAAPAEPPSPPGAA